MKYIRYYHTSDERSLLDDSISDIVEDKARGILWIGTHCGLSVLHDKGSILSFENFKSGLKIGDLPYNNITSLLLSHDGQLWVAMEGGGICKTQMREFQFLDNSSSTLRNNYNISSILSLSYIGEGNFWLGLPDVGLIQYNIHSGKVQSAKDLPGLSRMPSHTSITSILRRKVDNTLWFATADQGIWIYDSSYGTLHQMSRMYDPILRGGGGKYSGGSLTLRTSPSTLKDESGSRSMPEESSNSTPRAGGTDISRLPTACPTNM